MVWGKRRRWQPILLQAFGSRSAGLGLHPLREGRDGQGGLWVAGGGCCEERSG